MNLKNKFNIAFIKLSTKAEGPFDRCCIWFQGCNIHCPGCGNEALQALIPNHIIGADKLLEIVKYAKEKFGIEGITLSGGEPSLQKGLKDFNDIVHQLGLGIIMFSGKYKEQLPEELINSVDLLIDGPFINGKYDSKRILLGSVNKSLNFVTEKYKNQADYFNNPVSIEEVTAEDYVFVNGD